MKGRKRDPSLKCEPSFELVMARKDEFDASADPEFNNPFAGLQIDGLPLGAEAVAAAQNRPAQRALGRVVLRRETAHRGGKTVIVIHDFAPGISNQSIEELGRKLRQACGCGGAIKQRTIEIQGNHVARLRALLEAEGFRVAGVK
jgi:translation initiation factor 1